MTTERTQTRRKKRVTLMLADRLPAFTADIGPGGACVEMADVFMPGAAVHGHLKLGRETFRFSGEVTWAKPGNVRRRQLSRFGVRFDQVSGPFWERFGERFGP